MGDVIDIRRVPAKGERTIDGEKLTTDDVVDFYCLLEREAVKKVIADVQALAEVSTFTAMHRGGILTGCEEILCRLQTLWGEPHDH